MSRLRDFSSGSFTSQQHHGRIAWSHRSQDKEDCREYEQDDRHRD
jgi:hypothetical protein